MTRTLDYPLRDFSALRGLAGLPDALVEAHLKLYAGYVKNVNLLRQRLSGAKPGVPEFSELHRRMGFEIDGMRLHELYFFCVARSARRSGCSAVTRPGVSFRPDDFVADAGARPQRTRRCAGQ